MSEQNATAFPALGEPQPGAEPSLSSQLATASPKRPFFPANKAAAVPTGSWEGSCPRAQLPLGMSSLPVLGTWRGMETPLQPAAAC